MNGYSLLRLPPPQQANPADRENAAADRGGGPPLVYSRAAID